MKKSVLLTLLAVIVITSNACAAGLYAGFEGLPWGTDIHEVMKKFPGGAVGKQNQQQFYIQQKPSSELAQRMFIFGGNKLMGVSMKYDEQYVKKTGVEKVYASLKKKFGNEAKNEAKATHVVSHVWEDKETRVSYAYAPKRADMTVLMIVRK